MQIKKECEFCTKSTCLGKDQKGELKFGCKNSFCIFDPIVENIYRDQIKHEYKIMYK